MKMLIILLIAFCLFEALVIGYLAVGYYEIQLKAKDSEPLDPISFVRSNSHDIKQPGV